jgi:ribosomal protein S18 acetylase RimI-like enzyme
MLRKDLGTLYWFVHNNQYIGRCDIIKSRYVPNAIELWCFGIQGDMRGKGYGQQFLREVIQEFDKQTIVLFVEKRNERALHIYHKLGFKIVGEYRGGNYAWEMRLER